MKKRAFAIVLALMLCLGAIPASIAFAAPQNDGLSEAAPLAVPTEGLAFENGTVYGIKKSWFSQINPDQNNIFLSVTIPDIIDGQPVTDIASDAFTTAYTSEKKAKNAVTYNDNLGLFYLTAADFTGAVNLETIQKQAFNGNKYLSGTVDLSNTKLISIDKMAFQSCTKLTTVILPETLESLGASSGGSVFKGCTGLTSIRTKNDPEGTAFSLPAQLKYIGTDTFNGAFAQPVTVTIPESVIGIGSQAFYSGNVTRIIVHTTTTPTSFFSGSGNDWLSGKINTKALKASGLDMVLFTNAEVYEAYYNNYEGLNSEKEKFTFPITVHFLSEDNETILETQTKLYNFPLNYTFVNDWTQNSEYRFPQIDGSETQWFIDGNNNALKETNKLKSSPIQDVFEFVPEVKRVIIPENPTIVPILDGEDLPANQNKLVVGDDRAHSFGIRVDHALLEKPQNPAEGDMYVTFQYKWTDIVDGAIGPRSGGASAWPEKEFGQFGPYNTISIEGTEHERIENGDYYLVEIEGYVWRYNGNEWIKDDAPYFKTKHTIIGGDNSDATVDLVYLFYVDVIETYTVTYTDGVNDATLFEDQIHKGLQLGDKTPAYEGECIRNGYVFYGWTPSVANTVNGNAVYTALWEIDANHNGVADKDEDTYTIIYTDGVEEETIFPDQVYDGLLSGLGIPAFAGTPERDGYVFAGWKPDVAETVTASVTYEAQWKTDANHNGTADEDEDTYTIIYTDGVEEETIFPDQVYDGLLSGLGIPAFVGTPERDGYIFKGWSPEVNGQVQKDTVFTAQWKKNATVDTSSDESADPPASSEVNESVTPPTGSRGIWIPCLVLLFSAGILGRMILGLRKRAK